MADISGSGKTRDTLLQYLHSRRGKIEAALSAYLSPDSGESSLVEAMRYSMFPGGKRLRPLLCIAAAEACGAEVRQILPAACSFELIHTFSLIHDDLPAIDDDDMRRGRPSCHVRFGESVAILAGDALLARAFELLGEQGSLCPPERSLRALRVVSAALGVNGMAGGQVADLSCNRKDITLADLERIHALKTAALFRACTTVGAILAGGREDEIAALGNFGEGLGMAFQIQDDILDAAGDSAKITIVKDKEGFKATYVSLCGLDKSREAAWRRIQEACLALEAFGEEAAYLREIALAMMERNC